MFPFAATLCLFAQLASADEPHRTWHAGIVYEHLWLEDWGPADSPVGVAFGMSRPLYDGDGVVRSISSQLRWSLHGLRQGRILDSLGDRSGYHNRLLFEWSARPEFGWDNWSLVSLSTGIGLSINGYEECQWYNGRLLGCDAGSPLAFNLQYGVALRLLDLDSFDLEVEGQGRMWANMWFWHSESLMLVLRWTGSPIREPE